MRSSFPCPCHHGALSFPSHVLLVQLLTKPCHQQSFPFFSHALSPHSAKRPPLPYSPGGPRFKGMDKLRKPLRAVTKMQAATRRPQSAAMIRQLRDRQGTVTTSVMRTKEAPAAMLPHKSQPGNTYTQEDDKDEAIDLRRRRRPSATELRVTLH